MALPGSGEIRFSSIATELGVALSNVSLRSMSAAAGKSSPDGMTEFYGYSAITPISASYAYSVGTCTGDSFTIYVNSSAVVGPSSFATSGTIMVTDNDVIEVYVTSGTKGLACGGSSANLAIYLNDEFYDGTSDLQYGFGATSYISYTVPNGFSGTNSYIDITGALGFVDPGEFEFGP
jgi:hypothetical protein